MTYSFKTAGWPERLWRTNNRADLARGNVPGSTPFSTFGEFVSTGAVTNGVVWETGMPLTLTVPNSIQLTVASSSASDTGDVAIRYLDGNLVERTEVVTLDGTTPVTTVATDIRAINNAYSKDGPVVGNVTMTSGGTTYARVQAGGIQFNTSLVRVPINKRLMVTAIYAGATSSTSDAKVTVKLETSFTNGDSFANQGYLHPLGAVSLQNNTATFPDFGPFPIPAGEWIGFTFKADKAVDVTAGLFGWLENA
jgi:hypothetical protein